MSSGIEVAFLGYVSPVSCSLSVFPVSVPIADAITSIQAIVSKQGCSARFSASGSPIVVFQRVCGLDCNVLASNDGSIVIMGTSEGTGWSGRGFAIASLLRELSIAAAHEIKGCSHDTLADVWRISRFGAAKETTLLPNSKPPRRSQVAEDASTNYSLPFHRGVSSGDGLLLQGIKERATLEPAFSGAGVAAGLSRDNSYGDASLNKEESYEVIQHALEGTEPPVVPLERDYPDVAHDTSSPLDSVPLSMRSLSQVPVVDDSVESEGQVIGVSNSEPQMQQPEHIQTLKGQEFQVYIALVEDLEVIYQGSSLQRSTITGKARITACPVPCVLTITYSRGVVENVMPNTDILSHVETESSKTEWHLSYNTSSAEIVHPGDDDATSQKYHWVDALTYNCSSSFSPVPLRVYCDVKEDSTEPSGCVLSHRCVLVIVRIVVNPKLPSPLFGVKVAVKLSSLPPKTDLEEKEALKLTPAQNAGWNPEYRIAWWNVPNLSAGENIELEVRESYKNNSSAPLPTSVPVQVLGYSKNANFSGALLSIAADDVLAPGLSVTGSYDPRLRISYTLS